MGLQVINETFRAFFGHVTLLEAIGNQLRKLASVMQR